MKPPQKIYDILPNDIRITVKKLRRVVDAIRNELEREPTAEEIAKEIKLPLDRASMIHHYMLLVQDPTRYEKYESIFESMSSVLACYLLKINSLQEWHSKKGRFDTICEVLEKSEDKTLRMFFEDCYTIISNYFKNIKPWKLGVNTRKKAISACIMANRKEMLENCSEKILASEISPQDIPRVIWLNHDQFSYGDIDACYHWLLQEIDNDIRSWMQLLSQGQMVNWQSLIVNVKSHLPEDCMRFLEAHLAHVGKDLKRSAYRYILVPADLELSDSQFMRIRRKLIRYLQSGILRNLLIDNGYLLGDRYIEPPLDSLAIDEQLGLADLIALELDDEV